MSTKLLSIIKNPVLKNVIKSKFIPENKRHSI